jgi:lipopolysaccharide transport system permease protein
MPNLVEVYQFRDLLFVLTLRQIKLRYRQTLLGVTWIVLQPLLLMAVFTLVFGRVGALAPNNVPYALFVLAGLVPWQLFARCFGDGTTCLVAEKTLIERVYFPRLIVVLTVALVGLVDLAMPMLILLIASVTVAFEQMGPNLLYLPLFLLLEVVTVLGVVLWLAPLNVRYRDVGLLVPFLTLVLMFATPVVFPLSFLPSAAQQVLAYNPLATAIEGVRWSLLGAAAAPGWPQAISAGIAIVLCASGLMFFSKHEGSFADEL